MVKTKKIAGDVDYAGVPDRLKEFREQNSRADVRTEHTWLADGGLDFKAFIIVDKSDENSASATGTAHYSPNEMKVKKSFEKLETISVGRALAILGYLNNGQVATSEEMEEFNEYQDQKIEDATDALRVAPDIDTLKDVFMSLGSLMAHSKVIEAKNARKEELQSESN